MDYLATAPYVPNCWVPKFDSVKLDRWRVGVAPLIPMKNYWGGMQYVQNMPTLIDQNDHTWMSICPSEIQSQELGWQMAFGHVVIIGFGMGISVGNTALNPNVTKVTVIDRDPEILHIAKNGGLLEQLPGDAQEKITLIQGDAYMWENNSDPIDLLQLDYWLPLHDANRHIEVRSLYERLRPKMVFFWGQETTLCEMICRKNKAPKILTDPALEALIAEDFQFPLLCPRDRHYGEMLMAAGKQMLDHGLALELGLRP